MINLKGNEVMICVSGSRPCEVCKLYVRGFPWWIRNFWFGSLVFLEVDVRLPETQLVTSVRSWCFKLINCPTIFIYYIYMKVYSEHTTCRPITVFFRGADFYPIIELSISYRPCNIVWRYKQITLGQCKSYACVPIDMHVLLPSLTCMSGYQFVVLWL